MAFRVTCVQGQAYGERAGPLVLNPLTLNGIGSLISICIYIYVYLYV